MEIYFKQKLKLNDNFVCSAQKKQNMGSLGDTFVILIKKLEKIMRHLGDRALFEGVFEWGVKGV